MKPKSAEGIFPTGQIISHDCISLFTLAASFMIPMNQFFSVPIHIGYDAHTRTFIANGTKKRHLSSRDKLIVNEDGSKDIFIGPSVPKGFKSNWIETLPGNKIYIGLRTYGPEQSVLNGDYKIPRFEVVE